jgi:hypothetical protein
MYADIILLNISCTLMFNLHQICVLILCTFVYMTLFSIHYRTKGKRFVIKIPLNSLTWFIVSNKLKSFKWQEYSIVGEQNYNLKF